MAKPRILILTNRVPYPLNDGGSLAINAMLEGYVKAGMEVFLFSMNTSRHFVPVDTLPAFYEQIAFETFDIKTDIRLVPTLKNFFLSRKPNHAERFYDKAFGERLKIIIDRFEPDIVQLESVYLATYLPEIKEATNQSIAIRLHNIEYQIWERLTADASSFRKYYLRDLYTRIKKFEVNAWSEADILIPITEEDAAVVAELLPEKKIIVAPFGIDMSMVKVSRLSTAKWIGYHIGAMDWVPNAEAIRWFLEEVWSDLHKQVPSFEFHFAGRNMPGSFEKYEQNGVVCAGEVPSASEFIADKKVLIVPLRSGSGIRIKILEAMAADKLVVSTSVGMQGITGVVPGKHFLLAEEKEDFIRQIKWLMEHKQQAEEIAKAGSELVRKEYDEEKIMSRLISKMGLNEG